MCSSILESKECFVGSSMGAAEVISGKTLEPKLKQARDKEELAVE